MTRGGCPSGFSKLAFLLEVADSSLKHNKCFRKSNRLCLR